MVRRSIIIRHSWSCCCIWKNCCIKIYICYLNAKMHFKRSKFEVSSKWGTLPYTPTPRSFLWLELYLHRLLLKFCRLLWFLLKTLHKTWFLTNQSMCRVLHLTHGVTCYNVHFNHVHSPAIRLAATNALLNSLEFTKQNFEREVWLMTLYLFRLIYGEWFVPHTHWDIVYASKPAIWLCYRLR